MLFEHWSTHEQACLEFFKLVKVVPKIAELEKKEYYVSCVKLRGFMYRVIFLTGPPLKMSLDWPPSKMLRLAPPTLKKF